MLPVNGTNTPLACYLVVMFDGRLNFIQQVEHVMAKVSAVRASLAKRWRSKLEQNYIIVFSDYYVASIWLSIWADTLEA